MRLNLLKPRADAAPAQPTPSNARERGKAWRAGEEAKAGRLDKAIELYKEHVVDHPHDLESIKRLRIDPENARLRTELARVEQGQDPKDPEG